MPVELIALYTVAQVSTFVELLAIAINYEIVTWAPHESSFNRGLNRLMNGGFN